MLDKILVVITLVAISYWLITIVNGADALVTAITTGAIWATIGFTMAMSARALYEAINKVKL